MKNLKYLVLVLIMAVSLVGCKQAPNKTETVENKEPATKVEEKETKVEETKPTEVNEKDLDKAVKVALTDAGVKEADVNFTKKEYDSIGDDYEIEFTHDGKEYEYEIKPDGTIKDKDIDVEKVPPSTENLIGEDKAKKIALEKAGVSESEITDYKQELDTDDGKTVYEISFDKGKVEYEYKIDAVTGDIIKEQVDQ